VSHYKSDCWAEGGSKASQGLKGKGKGETKANAAAAAEAEENSAWMAIANRMC
jgi:hypothetical protein